MHPPFQAVPVEHTFLMVGYHFLISGAMDSPMAVPVTSGRPMLAACSGGRAGGGGGRGAHRLRQAELAIVEHTGINTLAHRPPTHAWPLEARGHACHRGSSGLPHATTQGSGCSAKPVITP